MKLISLMSILFAFSFSSFAGVVRNNRIKCENERYIFTIQDAAEALGVTPVQLMGDRAAHFEISILNGSAGNSEFKLNTYGDDCRNLANTGEFFIPVSYFTDSFNEEIGAKRVEILKKVDENLYVSESGIQVMVLKDPNGSTTIVLTQPKTGFVMQVSLKRRR